MKIIKLFLKLFAAAIVFVVVLVALLPKSGTSPIATAVSVAAGVETSPVTLEAFESIRTGMKYGQVVKILGGEAGTEMSRSDLAGYETVMYQWQSSGLGNMNAMFQNGKLITKAQFGLR